MPQPVAVVCCAIKLVRDAIRGQALKWWKRQRRHRGNLSIALKSLPILRADHRPNTKDTHQRLESPTNGEDAVPDCFSNEGEKCVVMHAQGTSNDLHSKYINRVDSFCDRQGIRDYQYRFRSYSDFAITLQEAA